MAADVCLGILSAFPINFLVLRPIPEAHFRIKSRVTRSCSCCLTAYELLESFVPDYGIIL
jgi:hypothetical protein